MTGSLDELMTVWRSQDAVPLYGVNETLLRLALRQDQAKVQAARRRDGVITSVASALLIGAMVVFALLMAHNDDGVIVSWDYMIPAAGAAAAMLMGVALYLGRRSQRRREENFGDSLRDQIRRRIAQLDHEATNGTRVANLLLAAIFVGSTAILLGGMRVNSEPGDPFEDWPTIAGMIVISAATSIGASRAQRHSVNHDILPRKQRLESLLKDLDETRDPGPGRDQMG